MNKPLLSIIIPVYNRRSLFLETYNSIDKRNDIEIIVIDDGSDNETAKFLDSLKDEKTFIYHQKNEGISRARNKGILKSKGKYLFLLDSDDIMTEKMNNFIRDDLENSKYKIARFMIQKMHNHKNIGFWPSKRVVGKTSSYNISQVSSFIFKREVFNNLKFRGRFAEDKIFIAELYEKYSYKHEIINFASIIYRDTNISSIMRGGVKKTQISNFLSELSPEDSKELKLVAWMVSKDIKRPELLLSLDIKRRNIFWIAPFYFKIIILFRFK